jgi:peroxiredoxin
MKRREMFLKRFLVHPICLLTFLLTLVVAQSTKAQNAIDFTLKDLDGKETKLSDHYGEKIILINFWATWCLPCIKELPHLQKIYEAYQDKDFIMFTISVDGPGTLAQVRNSVNRNNYNFPVLLDTESKVVALYNPRVLLPYTILIDKEGQIYHVQQGYSPGDEAVLKEKILELFEPREAGKKKEISVHAHEAFLYRHFSNNEYVEKMREGRSSQILNQFDLALVKGDFILGMRFDWNLDFSPADGKFRLVKRFFRLDKEKIYLNLGDFYHSIGRGLTLSLLKTFEEEGPEYLIDTTVNGGRVAFSTKTFKADFLGGWIERERSGIKDKVFAATLGWKHRNFSTLQLSLVGSHLEEASLWGNKDVLMQSVSLDIPNISDKAKLFGEFTFVQKDKYAIEEKIHGHGLYLESGLFLGRFSFLTEFKDYKHMDYEYNRPPLLESEELEILADQFNNDVTDSTGISARIDYSFFPIPTLLYGKFFYSFDNPKEHFLYGSYQKEIIHFFSGIETKFKSTGYLNALAGYRRENSSDVFFLTFGKTFHYQFNISYPLTSNVALEFDWKSKDLDGEYIDYFERRSFLSIHYASRMIFTLLFEQTDNPEILFATDKKDWWALQAEWRFAKGNSIRLFYGSTKGGVKCSGGLCRLFPPFKGLRLEVIWRF